MENKAVMIDGIVSGSIAEEAGLEAGDRMISINRKKPLDIFDYRLLSEKNELLLIIGKKNGEILELTIEKDEDEDIGLVFFDPLFNGTRKCRNKCIFCFIDQLPPGMRPTLYLKDDDSRLSFLSGNYITLTNMDEQDIKRIIKFRMSPVNISIHTTDLELRRFMLGNAGAGDILPEIKRFYQGGIAVNCQIVLCRGINDGANLDKTLAELTYTGVSGDDLSGSLVNSISVVPAGLTKYRSRLYPIKPYDKYSSFEVVRSVNVWQERLIRRIGKRIVFAADEFYLMAELPFPEYEDYEEFPQLENGVGMVSLMKCEFKEAMALLDSSYSDTVSEYMQVPAMKRTVGIITGMAAYELLKVFAAEIEALPGISEKLHLNIYGIVNDYFGNSVTVAGLITGSDILKQLNGMELGDELLIPRNMLKSGENVLLDGYTVDMLQNALNVRITSVEDNGRELVKYVMGPLADGIFDER